MGLLQSLLIGICFVLQKDIFPPDEECYVRLFSDFIKLLEMEGK